MMVGRSQADEGRLIVCLVPQMHWVEMPGHVAACLLKCTHAQSFSYTVVSHQKQFIIPKKRPYNEII